MTTRTDYDMFADEIAVLRAALFRAVPAARDDYPFNEMMGSPWSVLQYVTEYFNKQVQSVPQPDWSQAPAWANWWTVDAMGLERWFRHEPHLLGTGWNCRGRAYKQERVRYITIPIGIDWRTLKRQRPQVQP